MKKIEGTQASFGFSNAKIFLYYEEELKIKESKIKNTKAETQKFAKAIKEASRQISKLRTATKKKLGEEHAQIFDAHIEILKDPEISSQVISLIESSNSNAAFALETVAKQFIEIFKNMDDPYFRERAADIKDVTTRVLKILEGIPIVDLSQISEEVIIVAYDLTPSETSQLNKKYIKGFITEIGGRTSHSAIMARTLEIPAIVGVGPKKIKEFKNNEKVIIDGLTGEIFINPTKSKLIEFEKKLTKYNKYQKEVKKFKNKKTTTLDGWKTNVAGNIGEPNDINGVISNGGEGVGLFRTEFLYMDAETWPTEDEQYEAYSKVLEASKNHSVVIRTLDIGGDKKLDYYKFKEEMNPFLGIRAVRFQLSKVKEVMIPQVRALLRASVHGKLAIDIPMIATIDEFRKVKKVFKAEEKKLKSKKIKVGDYELGIMVEIPAVAVNADNFAKEADFFSIGTNDLIQYTFAADRLNQDLSYLYQPFNPSILRLINNVIKASHVEKKWTAICGELASEPKLTPIFVGMGLDEFSMTASSILPIRKLISELDKKKCEELVEKILKLPTSTDVEKEIDKFIKKNNIDFI